ncbi:hypothetical protein DY138_00790 [Apilactobacillus timberlakei]|uniref:hypothetical protein n=1 Tax=Apilactobacillus timberlakei TaxID=2008380 RepID=UPI00112CEA54|nr:hypothetical protein [Apilactobacillus timberlakei]TPR20006.1 hypothetical protein DY138_00790 [Apilactobacillus timberlakei]TPR21724.1 hypothetical protein DY061_00705 [Apilactobacillus timberlakei]TPR22970.1 hypothetical protein DY083_02525 [Apilactobacillus timberlakei]
MQENILYAQPVEDNDIYVRYIGTEPINIGKIKYYGYRKEYLKEVDDSNADHGKRMIIDDSKPPQYDEITQLFMDSQNTNQLNAKLMLDNFNQKRINAQMMLEINNLKSGGTK